MSNFAMPALQLQQQGAPLVAQQPTGGQAFALNPDGTIPSQLLTGQGSLTLINDTTLSGATATVDISSIPATYKALQIWFSLRGDNASATVNTFVRLNADSGTNYDYQTTRTNNATVSAVAAVGTGNGCYVGESPANTATANCFSGGVVNIPNYASTSQNKDVLHTSGARDAAAAANLWANTGWGGWNNTAAITEVTFRPSAGNWVTGSRVTVFGVK